MAVAVGTAVNPRRYALVRSPNFYSGFDCLAIAGEWRPGHSSRVLVDRDPYDGAELLQIRQGDRDDLEMAYRLAAATQAVWATELPGVRAAVIRRAAEILADPWGGQHPPKGEPRMGINPRDSGVGYRDVVSHPSTYPAYRYPRQGGTGPAQARRRGQHDQPGELAPTSLHPISRARPGGRQRGCRETCQRYTAHGGDSSRKNFRREVCRQASSASSLAPAAKSARPLSHPSVPRVISFTGSTAKAEIIKRVDLALGANGPVVVLEDADLEAAVEVALFGKFLHQGQICIAVNRLIVDDHVHDRFLKLFVERVRSLKIGDPNEPDTCIEPIINVSQLNRLIERIRRAPQAGVRQVVGGEPQGLVLPPHVFADVINNRDLARDVLFGPVTPIIRARGDDDALRLANATQYGLRGAVFTGEAERGRRFAQRLKVGMAHVNDQSAVDLPNSPFGREKNSGIGRFNDTWAIEAFALLESKAAHAHH